MLLWFDPTEKSFASLGIFRQELEKLSRSSCCCLRNIRMTQNFSLEANIKWCLNILFDTTQRQEKQRDNIWYLSCFWFWGQFWIVASCKSFLKTIYFLNNVDKLNGKCSFLRYTHTLISCMKIISYLCMYTYAKISSEPDILFIAFLEYLHALKNVL